MADLRLVLTMRIITTIDTIPVWDDVRVDVLHDEDGHLLQNNNRLVAQLVMVNHQEKTRIMMFSPAYVFLSYSFNYDLA